MAGTLEQAICNAYDAVDKIHFAGAHYRTDIGAKGVTNSRAAGDIPRG
jgi:phosphoribosylamine-glycine ligase